MARVTASGFGSLGKAISDVLATALHHALVTAIPHLDDRAAERTARIANNMADGADDILSPVFSRVHDNTDPSHPLHPVIAILAGKNKAP